jgi:uncharacterized membrane protein YfcA
MPDAMLLAAAVFAGAVVSGLAGFAFSAAAGAILIHLLSPQEAVPLMMACSIAVQAASLVSLRHSVRWRESLRYIIGGGLGLAPALYLLVHVDAGKFRIGFGVFLVIYSAYMLARPRVQFLRAAETRVYDALVGFAGGLVGGLTAMPGAAPIVWCDLQGFPKEQQRGLVQPFIAAMQLVSMAILFATGHISSRLAVEFATVLPALAVGTALGIYLFGKVGDATFRRIVLVALLVSGGSFIWHL